MIQRDFIVAWRQQAPWPTDAQVEQDLVLSRALVEIFRDPLLSRELAFRGGTALHKLFLPTPARYSEDIDLVQISPGPIGPVMSALRKLLDPWLGIPRRSQSEGRMTFIYRFESELPPIVPLRKYWVSLNLHLIDSPIRRQSSLVQFRVYPRMQKRTVLQLFRRVLA